MAILRSHPLWKASKLYTKSHRCNEPVCLKCSERPHIRELWRESLFCQRRWDEGVKGTFLDGVPSAVRCESRLSSWHGMTHGETGGEQWPSWITVFFNAICSAWTCVYESCGESNVFVFFRPFTFLNILIMTWRRVNFEPVQPHDLWKCANNKAKWDSCAFGLLYTRCSLCCASQEAWLTHGGSRRVTTAAFGAKISLRQVYSVFSAQGCYYSFKVITQLEEISLLRKGGN